MVIVKSHLNCHFLLPPIQLLKGINSSSRMNRFTVLIVIAVSLIYVDGRHHHHPRRRHGGGGGGRYRHHKGDYNDGEDSSEEAASPVSSSKNGRGIIKFGFQTIKHMWDEKPAVEGVELPANSAANWLVAYHAQTIVQRAHLESDDEQPQAPQALSFIELRDGQYYVYYIKVLVRGRFYVHVKIAAAPDVQGNPDWYQSKVVTVVTGKRDTNNLDPADFT